MATTCHHKLSMLEKQASACRKSNSILHTGWHIICTENHWANDVTTLQYIDVILLPYVNRKRKEIKLSFRHSCLVIFDTM